MGDSHTYDLYHAVACLMLDFWDYNYQGPRPIDGEDAAFEALSEHVVHSKPPECLPLAEGTMICHFRVNHGQVRAARQGHAHGHGLLMIWHCSSRSVREDCYNSSPRGCPPLKVTRVPHDGRGLSGQG